MPLPLLRDLFKRLDPQNPVASAGARPYPAARSNPEPKARPVNQMMLDINGRPVALEVRVSPRARRMLLRVDHKREVVVLTLPRATSEREGLRFAMGQTAWIAARLAALPPRTSLAPGARVPILGVEHLVRHRPDARGTVWLEEGEIHVAGGIEFLPRRLSDYLRRRARQEIASRVAVHATRVTKPVKGITVRDTASRWGSCSPTGGLSFSWRLVLAPAVVLDYVVAHEVAHLAHFDHSPRFWGLVGEMIDDVEGPRRWLRDHGAALHRFG